MKYFCSNTSHFDLQCCRRCLSGWWMVDVHVLYWHWDCSQIQNSDYTHHYHRHAQTYNSNRTMGPTWPLKLLLCRQKIIGFCINFIVFGGKITSFYQFFLENVNFQPRFANFSIKFMHNFRADLLFLAHARGLFYFGCAK